MINKAYKHKKTGNVVLQEALLPDGTPNPKVGKAVKIDNYPKPKLEQFIKNVYEC